MQVPAQDRRSVRFGPFAVDLVTREVWNGGSGRISLQEKPFQILATLLERPGQLVTREELQQRLWPAGTFVDFDHSINTAIKKLREALQDDAEEPRFIETLPRRGYRFIGQLEETAGEPAVSVTNNESAVRQTWQARLHRHWYLVLGVALLAISASLGANPWGIRDRLLHRTISEEDTVVIADFSNSTGEPLFDDTLKQALTTALKQSPFLNVLSERRVATSLRHMARPPDTALTGDVIRELCQRAGSKAYIAGSIAKLDGEYALGLKAVNCQSGTVLAKELTTVAGRDQVLDALGKEAARMRAQLGESLAMVQKFDVPLSEATTSSLEALKAYSLAAKAYGGMGEPGDPLSLNLRAIQLDPNFALGHLAVGASYLNLGESGRASAYFTKAFELRGREDEHDRLLIGALYYLNATGELDKARQVLEERIASYPRETGAYINLGVVRGMQGQYEKALAPSRQCLRLAPDSGSPYPNLVNALLALQRFDDVRKEIHEAHARKLDNYLLHSALYALAFLGRDTAAMADQQQWFTGKPEENLGLSLASDTEAYLGHLRKARDLTRQAVDSAIAADSKETAAISQENAALREAAIGNTMQARKAAAEGLKLMPESQGVLAEAALALAMTGEDERVQKLEQNLNTRYPLDTQIQSMWLPAIRSQLSLHRKNPLAAVTDLAPAAGPIELGQITFATNLSCLYPTYMRGQAELAAGNGAAAATEFQKILDHDGIVWNCWTAALARLGTGRANTLVARASQGAEADAAHARAITAYRDFLTLWKDADPDIPILKQAKAEYAAEMRR